MVNKVGYFEVINGCAGDMIVASLIDAGLSISLLKKELKKIPLSNYSLKITKVKREIFHHHSVEATKFTVVLKREEKTRKYSQIVQLIEKSNLEEDDKIKILKIFSILAKAEAKIHKENQKEVHFHQVGQTDAIVEIAGAVIGLRLLGITEIFSSSVGIANVSPATLEIVKEIPVLIKNSPYETATPTGVSILKGLCKFEEMRNEIIPEKYGFGAGERKQPTPNIVKFICGREANKETESIFIIETNIDDMSPEIFEHLFDQLFKAGAVDVSLFTGIGKKNRPVFNLQVMVHKNNFEKIKEIIFSESTTIGFRYREEKRITLEREIKEIKTKWGKVRVKVSFQEGKIYNFAPEYEDCKKIALKNKIPLKKVYQEVNHLLVATSQLK